MKLFDFFTSTKRPIRGIPILPQEQVKGNILAINRSTAPFQIIDGNDEGVDLIAEWKIVDVAWYEWFAKAGIEKVFRIYLKFDDENHEVRASDREYSVSWRAGVPAIAVVAELFKGQKQSVEFGTAYAFTEDFKPGQVYNYRFNTNEMKKPIQNAVTECGWTYRGIAFGKL